MKTMTDHMVAFAMEIADHHLVDAVRFTALEMLRDARATMTTEQAAVYDEWLAERNSRRPPFVVG